jgi:hypothetical protein
MTAVERYVSTAAIRRAVSGRETSILAGRAPGLDNPHFAAWPRPINFKVINRAAQQALPILLARWLPNGKRVGREYVALNPTRLDRRAGSFKVNLETGRWADFATGDKGGDVVSLAAYLFKLRQSDAARRLADALGLGDAHHD